MKEGRDQWLQPLDEASDNNTAEIMDAEDPLFILYFGSGKPREWCIPQQDIWCTQPILLKMF
jgi:hypothetical protein